MKYLIFLFFIGWSSGQDLGVIEGVIKDTKTGEGLPGVNILIKGTYYGAAADANGRYRISKVKPGNYDIEASIIGYKVFLKTGIVIKSGEVINLDFIMEETVLAFGEDVLVMGKKPLFDVDETASVARVRREEIENKVVSSIEDILSEQLGVSSQDNEIHIRGGRIDESMFVVDGFSVKDPLSGYSGNLFVNADAIEELEIVTGGYNPEYGQAMSGVVNIKLKEGRDKYEGAFKYSSDRFIPDNFNSDRMEFNLGGPDLFFQTLPKFLGLDLPGNFSFFLNGYGKIYDGNLPVAKKIYPYRYWSLPFLSIEKSNSLMDNLSSRGNNDWHFLYKLTWSISAKKEINDFIRCLFKYKSGVFHAKSILLNILPISLYQYFR